MDIFKIHQGPVQKCNICERIFSVHGWKFLFWCGKVVNNRFNKLSGYKTEFASTQSNYYLKFLQVRYLFSSPFTSIKPLCFSIIVTYPGFWEGRGALIQRNGSHVIKTSNLRPGSRALEACGISMHTCAFSHIIESIFFSFLTFS